MEERLLQAELQSVKKSSVFLIQFGLKNAGNFKESKHLLFRNSYVVVDTPKHYLNFIQ